MGKMKISENLRFANKELAVQNEEQAAELLATNKELAFQIEEKGKRSDELTVANNELSLQKKSKEIRAAQLIIADKELAFQHIEKGKRAAELIIANKELRFENQEKGKRAAELILANKELIFQNEEKEKRAAELFIANKELAFQNEEKEKRSSELANASEELAVQNEANLKCAAELRVANSELVVQSHEKEKQAAELLTSVIDITERKMREAMLKKQNKELEQFAYIASHDLQQPLRTVSNYMNLFEEEYATSLDANASRYLKSVKDAIHRMSTLVHSILDFSQLGHNRKINHFNCTQLIADVLDDLADLIKTSNATIEVSKMPELNANETEIRQVFQNLIANAIKFQKIGVAPNIQIRSERINESWKISVKDNGIGISPVNFTRVFDIFQRLHSAEEYRGCGIGLAHCKKILELHSGEIGVESTLGKGCTFYFTIPDLQV
jgi:signal transduction histidine kinase